MASVGSRPRADSEEVCQKQSFPHFEAIWVYAIVVPHSQRDFPMVEIRLLNAEAKLSPDKQIKTHHAISTIQTIVSIALGGERGKWTKALKCYGFCGDGNFRTGVLDNK